MVLVCLISRGASTPIFGSGPISALSSAWHIQVVAEDENNNLRLICGGTLLSPLHVITYARCKSWHTYNLFVYAGSVNTLGTDMLEYIPVDTYMPHPKYKESESTSNFNVAMLTLKKGVPESDRLVPIAWNRDPAVPSTTVVLTTVGNDNVPVRQDVEGFKRGPDTCDDQIMESLRIAINSSLFLQYRGGSYAGLDDLGGGLVMGGKLLVGVLMELWGPIAPVGRLGIYIRTSAISDFIESELKRRPR